MSLPPSYEAAVNSGSLHQVNEPSSSSINSDSNNSSASSSTNVNQNPNQSTSNANSLPRLPEPVVLSWSPPESWSLAEHDVNPAGNPPK
ncbi:hypothetical protein VKT23_012505 [Stygiomarasmius scandens]|uniref:Uncharacterized protein n=1 Tax=Marasmiellus scandens TaxID=2682957 RepID=A0ABR1J6J6_9AGAR